VEGVREGEGRLQMPDGDVWEGGFVRGAMVGRGTMSYGDGRVYEGTVIETAEVVEGGVPHGEGKLTDLDGESYEGGFVMGEREGHGVIKTVDGDRFVGTFKAGKRHGPGKQHTADGTTFEGKWEDDRLTGQVVVLEGALFASDADGRVRRGGAVRGGLKEQFGAIRVVDLVVKGTAAGVAGFGHPGALAAKVGYARGPDLLRLEGGEAAGGRRDGRAGGRPGRLGEGDGVG
jgi:hypothetical protein